MSKAFDIIVFGATGYSGKLVLKYLLEKNEHTRIRLGIAGRTPSKLQDILKGYSVKEDQVGVIKADVSDESSIKSMCSQTNVLVNCVGPFFLYGESVVRNCIESKTDYVDITGETNFIKTMYTKYHQKASENNVLVIPAVAFDSLPVELLNCYTGETFKDFVKNNKEYNQCVMNTYGTIRGGGGLSHGTYLTVLQNLAGKAGSMRYSSDLSGLSKSGKPGYAEDAKGWVVPWPTCDAFEVNWSQRLLKTEAFKANPVSEAFQFEKTNYFQYYRVGKFIPWLTMLFGVILFAIAARIPPILKYLEKRMEIGQGPEKIEHGSFELTSFTTLKGGPAAKKFKTRVKGKMGYWVTGQLASEAALTILEEKKNFCVKGGVYPPGAVLYPHIMKRVDQFLTFETVN